MLDFSSNKSSGRRSPKGELPFSDIGDDDWIQDGNLKEENVSDKPSQGSNNVSDKPSQGSNNVSDNPSQGANGSESNHKNTVMGASDGDSDMAGTDSTKTEQGSEKSVSGSEESQNPKGKGNNKAKGKGKGKKGNGRSKTPPPFTGIAIAGFPFPGNPEESENEEIMNMLINYNEKFADALPAKYREKEIFTVISHLMMSQKCCSLLIGAPGTGKTKIVEEIARHIANQSPYTNSLNDHTVYELPLSSIVSGSGLVGDLERKVGGVIRYCEKEKVILFIDEIHQLCGDNNMTYSKIAQMLKPAMARGSMKIIGATTLQESKNLFDDPAFNRRFNRVQVSELSKEQTKDIIREVYMPKMASFYGIGFGDGIDEAIVSAAEKQKTISSHRPDNAITMLDQICANTLLKRNYNISVCHTENVSEMLKNTPVIVNTTHIDNYVRESNFALPDSFDRLKEKLFFRDNVIDRAYEILSAFVKMNEVFPEKKPFVLKIAGEACSGKSTLAGLIAEAFDEEPVFLDLADYIDAPSLNRIIGSPVGYIGSNSKKEMPFDIVETNHRKVIILDNMDSASPVVQEFFNSAVKTGLIKYADNRTVDISQCIVIEVTSKKVAKANIGFNTEKPDSGSTELLIEKLSKEEIQAGTCRLMSEMVRELKKDHSKYLGLPDEIELEEAEKEELVTARDMIIVAKKKLLKMI